VWTSPLLLYLVSRKSSSVKWSPPIIKHRWKATRAWISNL
jgi:hypothetical protein